jgi:hypothetical protein
MPRNLWLLLCALALAAAWLFWPRGDGAPAPEHAAAHRLGDTVGGADVAARREPAAPAPDAGAAAAAAARDADRAAVPTGVLHVLVRTETHAAVAGAHVQISDDPPIEGATDAAGRAEFTVREGSAFVSVEPPAGAALEAISGRIMVAAATTREAVLVLPSRAAATTASFWCRLVAAEDRTPLEGVRLSGWPGANERGVSDAGGLALVALRAEDAFLHAALPGRAPRRVVPEPGHEIASLAMEVPIERGADLLVVVVDDAGRPVDDCGLRAEILPWRLQWPTLAPNRGPAAEWLQRSDGEGRARLRDLPVRLPLQVAIEPRPGRGAPQQHEWVLEPGVNERRVVLLAGGAIQGRVVADAGAPLEGVRVFAMPVGAGGPDAAARTGPTDPTGADGRFTLAGLGPGTWEPGLILTDASRGEWVAVPLRVEVPAGGVATAELVAERERAIAGRALGPDGSPVAAASIDAARDDGFAGGDRTDAEGRFRIGKLRAGRYRLTTASFEGELGLAAPVDVEAGDETIELHLVPSFGRIEGRVAIGSGLLGNVWLMARCRDGDDVIGNRCELDGAFALRGLRPGTWDLAAHDRSGNAGVACGVQVVPGRPVTGLSIALEPAAVLWPSHADADAFAVLRGADVLAADNLEPGGVPGEAVVPPGPCTVVFTLAGRELGRRDLTVRAGARQGVTLP